MSPGFKLMPHEEIKRRLARMVGQKYVKRATEVTRYDVARWFGISEQLVRQHQTGMSPINDFWQVSYSRFFAFLDAGLFEIRFDEKGRKTLARVANPTKASLKKTPMPYVDFATMKLGFD